MVSSSLSLLYFLLSFHGGRQGSGPDRGRSPVEWTNKRTDGQTDGRTDGQTDKWKISPFYRTSSPIGAAAQKLELQANSVYKLDVSKKNSVAFCIWLQKEKQGRIHDSISRVRWAVAVAEVRSPFSEKSKA